MKRTIILGGLGQFGRTAAKELRSLGVPIKIASRGGGAELKIDANDANPIRSTIHSGDVVLDAAGPFQARSTALVEAAIELGFDVIDINDDLRYAEAVLAFAPRINSAGIRVLSSASSVSAVAAAVVRHSGVASPRCITAFLAPASRHTSNPGAARSLIRSVGRPVRIYRDGRMQERIGWSESRSYGMPPPIGMIHCRLFESADSVLLPRVWTSLKDVAMYVDTNTPGVNTLLSLAARVPFVRRLLERQSGLATRIARTLGSAAGGIGYEIEDANGEVLRMSITAEKNSFLTAVAPAILAARAIAEDRFPHHGLVYPDRHVDAEELFAFLESRGITLNCSWPR